MTSNDCTPLFDAIEAEDLDQLRKLLQAGVNPNVLKNGDTALAAACNSWRIKEKGYAMTKLLLEFGADPCLLGEENLGPLFEAVLSNDAQVMRLLLEHGADPNKEGNDPETLYDWAEFDYRFDEYDLYLPERATENDKIDEEHWLQYLERLAKTYGKNPPDYLRVLREYGALTTKELRNLQKPNTDLE